MASVNMLYQDSILNAVGGEDEGYTSYEHNDREEWNPATEEPEEEPMRTDN